MFSYYHVLKIHIKAPLPVPDVNVILNFLIVKSSKKKKVDLVYVEKKGGWGEKGKLGKPFTNGQLIR